MTDVFEGYRLYVSGKFPGIQKDEVWAWLLGAGAHGVTSKSVANAYLCPDPTDPKLVATGKKLFTLADLGEPLVGYLDRLKAAIESRRVDLKHHKNALFHLGYGPPADDALIARVEAALGFPVPADLLTLMRHFNGLSAVVAVPKRGTTIELPQDGAPLPYAGLADLNHPLWQGKIDWLIGTVALPTWEEIFLRPQSARICDLGGTRPDKEIVKIGSLKVKAGDLFPRLFAFDLYHHFGGAAVFADPKAKDLKVIYAFDYWADITSAHPVSLRTYMESVLAGFWGRIAHAGQRPIKPVSKTAWPTYIRNIHGAPYIFIELK
ncbi:MAG: SMI1/KNR4 family protein [Myxococcales bacterium]|nr:SMI1/KNR4 family protein [Myxococcales bacterium]MCB9702846.1 SMI1/KNR4 family protein [Myxococcales bacterium]